MRKKKNLPARMAACGEIIADSAGIAGGITELFGREGALEIEIGCGKGSFITTIARLNPDVNYLAIEKSADVAIIAAESAKTLELKNIRFHICDAVTLSEILPRHAAERIYLNFSDPWPGAKNRKRRLTHSAFLEKYKLILKERGEIHIKTDNRDLFGFSYNELINNGYDVIWRGIIERPMTNPYNIPTEYETRFVKMGMTIYHIRAVKKPDIAPES